jgi:hypothetical protein
MHAYMLRRIVGAVVWAGRVPVQKKGVGNPLETPSPLSLSLSSDPPFNLQQNRLAVITELPAADLNAAY